MKIEVKREFVGLNDFKYSVYKNGFAVATLQRQIGNGGKFHYTSIGLSKNFDMYIKDYFVPLRTEGDISYNLAGHFYEKSNGETILFYSLKKGKNVFKNIPFWSTLYEGKQYDIYEVGLKEQGTYYCMWSEGVTKAILVRDSMVRHRQSRYEIYSLEEVPEELLLLWTMYFDLTKTYPEKRYNKVIKVNTWQKEIKEKYDPDFIPRIKAMHGINE